MAEQAVKDHDVTDRPVTDRPVKSPAGRQPVSRDAPALPMPSVAQRAWLMRGLSEPGGKLPLFDRNGQRISPRTVKACLDHGWAEPWFSNPLKPEWLVCKLTTAGRGLFARP
jgi:hypothetical protein